MKTSAGQRKYYRGVCVQAVAEKLNIKPETVHRMATFIFLRTHKVIGKYKHYFIASTSDLSTNQMEEYLSRFRSWASVNFNVFVQAPGREDGKV